MHPPQEWPLRLRECPETRPWPPDYDAWTREELQRDLRCRYHLNSAQLSVPKGILAARNARLIAEELRHASTM